MKIKIAISIVILLGIVSLIIILSRHKCSNNCDICDSGKCTKCKDGFYGDNCDYICSTQCSDICNLDGSCVTCKPGFYGEKCENICGDSTGHCTTKGCDKENGKCVTCSDSKTSLPSCAYKCPDVCKTCDDDLKCKTCNDSNYDPSQGCTGCIDGFYIDKDICKKCIIPNCET